jgi:putative oxidoreductase
MTTQAIHHNAIEPSKALNIALWIVQIGTAGMFFMAGGSKLAGAPQMVGLFQAIGIGQWFRFLTGSLEVFGGALLLVPALSGLGGLLLTGVMAGAVATHLFIIGGNPGMAITLLLASAFVAWSRRGRTLSLIGR